MNYEPSEQVQAKAAEIFKDFTIIEILDLSAWLSAAVAQSLINQKRNYENEQKSIQLDPGN